MHLKHINNVSDIVHGTIQLSCIEKMIISTPQFNRLHKILQNSTLFLTFPCNSVKRFEHSIGTMHIAGNMFYHSLCNAGCDCNDNDGPKAACNPKDDTLDAFFEDLKTEMDQLYSDNMFRSNANHFVKKTHNDFTEKLWGKRNELLLPYEALLSKNIPQCVSDRGKKFDYLAVYQAIRITGLLHDVGHLPYSHALEKALENIFYTLSHREKENGADKVKYNDNEQRFIKSFNNFFGSSENKKIHEEIGKYISGAIFDSIIEEWMDRPDFTSSEVERHKKLEKEWPIYLIGLAAFSLVKKIFANDNTNGNNFFKSLHTIVDGTFDADRLDFICRDTYAASIDKHIVDYSKLVNSLKLIKTAEGFRVAPFIKYVNDVESFLHKRWEINTKLNYHHRAAKMYMLLIECVTELGLENLKGKPLAEISTTEASANNGLIQRAARAESSSNNNSKNDYLINDDISGIWETIYDLDGGNRLAYRLIQLDDGWLDTVLKKEYVSRFEPPFKNHRGKPLADKLEELISNRKNYFSLNKTDHDFLGYDEKIKEHFLKGKKLDDLIIYAKNLTNKYKGEQNPTETGKHRNLDIVINQLTELKDEKPVKKARKKNVDTAILKNNDMLTAEDITGFFYRRVSKPLNLLHMEDEVRLELTKELKEEIKKHNEKSINDVIVVFIPANVEVSAQILTFYSNDKLFDISAVSGIKDSLKFESIWTPGFYIYLCPKEEHFVEEADDTLKDRIGDVTASVLLGCIKDGLDRIERN